MPFACPAGFLLLLLGAAVIIGWSFHLPAMVRIQPGYAPMVFNTALCFSLAGSALLLSFAGRRWALLRAAAGGAVATLAGMVLLEHFLRTSLGVDWPVLHAWLPDASPALGRMPPGTATAFLMSGVVLVLAGRRRAAWARTLPRILTLGVATIGVLSLVGYLVSAQLLFPGYWFTGVAIHTACGLLLLAGGLWSIVVRLEPSAMPIFTREDDRIALLAGAVLIVTGLGAGIATFAVLQGRVETLVRDDLLIAHTNSVDAFQDMIELREANARIVATRPSVLRALREIQSGRHDRGTLANVRAVIDSFLQEGFGAIAYHDLDGRVVAAGGRFAESPAMTVTLTTPGKPELLWQQGFRLRSRLPLHDTAGKVGEVHVEQSLPALMRLVEKESSRGETWDMGLCVRRGEQLFCFPQRLTSEVFSTPLLNVAGEALPMTRALAGESGTTITRDYRAQNVVAAYGPAGSLGLGMVLNVDAKEVFQPIREQLLVAMGLLALLVACGTLLLRSKVVPLATGLMDASRQAQAELQRFRLALDNSADMIVIVDRTSMRIVDVNRTVCRLLGYERAELLRMGPEDILPVSRQDLEKSYDELIAGSTPGGMESYYLCKDGSRLPFEATRHVLRSSDKWLVAAISRDIRQRQAAQARLRESEERFRSLSALSSDWFWAQDEEHRFVDFSGGDHERGWGPDQRRAIGMRRWELPGVSPVGGTWDEHKATLDARKPFRDFEYQRAMEDGTIRYVSASGEPVFDADGRFKGYRGVATDITKRKGTEARLNRLNRVLAMQSGINSLIVRVAGREELFKESCRLAVEVGGFRLAWIGVADREAMRLEPVAWHGAGQDYIELMPMQLGDPSLEAGGMSARVMGAHRPVVSDDMTRDPRIVLRKQAEERGFRSLAMLPLIVGEEAVGILALYAGEVGFFDQDEMNLLLELAGNISFALDRMVKAEKLEYLASYDPLTGLANRSLFLDRLSQRIADAAAAGRRVVVWILDIERFRTINDAFGRQGGDKLLRDIVERMKTLAREPVRLARIGGDQIAVLRDDMQSEDEIARFSERRIQDIFGQPYQVAGQDVRVSGRYGIALYPGDGGDAESLLRNAEAALKKAKALGEKYVFFAQEMTARTHEKIALESRLRQALEKEEFVLHYQPKVDVETIKVVGVEALIRWQSAEGLVPPAKFIPLMEETGIIRDAGAWALRRAVLDHRHWLRMGVTAPRVAVNVSPIQLRRHDFVETVKEIVAQGANPPGLDLEITESLIMEDVEGHVRKLKAIRDLGVSIAIDDFGTGYSSLAYLAKLPVETLKIDRSFIIGMLKDPNTMMLVQTMITLAHSLRLKVVAEGVETDEQAKMLRLLRCDELQGYLISKPVPIEDLTPQLRKEP